MATLRRSGCCFSSERQKRFRQAMFSRSLILADARLVLAECHVEGPVAAVLDGPVILPSG
jgi:hypothetical protein